MINNAKFGVCWGCGLSCKWGGFLPFSAGWTSRRYS
jgi:hypothetical protein